MHDLIVYSCVTGGYDKVKSAVLASAAVVEHAVRFVLFTDDPTLLKSGQYVRKGSTVLWEVKPLKWKHESCKRRTARWHKVNSHKLFPSASGTLWLDGSQRLKHGVRVGKSIILPALSSNVIATFKHPLRGCIYQEQRACTRLKKDNPALMQRQVEGYRKEGYPASNGMVETSCVVRANTTTVDEFNDRWWQEIESNSLRDQLSFNYVAWKMNICYGHLVGSRDRSPFCDFVAHGRT